MGIPHEFSLDTRREVIVGLSMNLGIDRAAPAADGGPPEKKVVRMTLRHRDEHGRETEVNEWSESELYGKGIDVETITRGIELSACRDAAYQFSGECIYVLAFHGKDHPNKSRFLFKIPAGQEVQHIAQASGGGFGMQQKNEASIAERLMPDILRYVQAKEEVLEKSRNQFTESILKSNNQYASVIQEYTDREAKIRQIELNADDHIYERERKKREDEESAEMKRQMMGLIKTNAPKLVPYVIAAVQRLSQGPKSQRPMQPQAYVQPGTPGQDPEYDAWVASQQSARSRPEESAVSQEAAASQAWYRSGGAGMRGGATESREAGAPVRARVEVREASVSGPGPSARVSTGEGPAVGSAGASGSPDSDLEKIKLRVAFDTARFVMLARGRHQLDAIRSALSDEQKPIFEEVVASADSADLDSEEGVSKAAGLALSFGAAVQADPASGFRLLGSIDNMTKLALIELSNLLKIFHETMIGAT